MSATGNRTTEEVERLIIGAGTGGLTAALALGRQGHMVHVLERQEHVEEAGYGIQLAPNATRILDRIGVLDPLLQVGVRPSAIVYMDALSGQVITSMDLGDDFISHFGYPYVVVHRSDLQRALLAGCAEEPTVTVELGCDVVALHDHGSSVLAECADGRSYRASMAIAADGVHSRIRLAWDQTAEQCDGFVAYRGTLPTEQVPQSEYLDAMVYWVGPDAHAVQYKIRAGELYNQVCVFRSPRFAAGDPDWGSPDELDAHYAGFCAPLRTAASMLVRTKRYPLVDRDPMDRWASNRIAVLGDAAHPMLPVLAQGGCQAIEDAGALANSVLDNPDAVTALQDYERERVPRSRKVQMEARHFADICHIHGVGVELRNSLFRLHDPRDYRPLDWLYADRRVLS